MPSSGGSARRHAPVAAAEVVGQANEALRGIGDVRVDDAYEKLGQWFADHVRQSGYHAHVNQMLLKQMILVAFPRLLEVGEELTPDNVEQFFGQQAAGLWWVCQGRRG